MKKKVVLLVVILLCIRFAELKAQIVRDIEGNIYSTITIGKQIWFFQNLKTTKFNDGREIPIVNDEFAWGALTTPAFCWLNNNPENGELYGALYNWYAVNTKKLCPSGWHVPTDGEWSTMISFLGDPAFAGTKLKEADLAYWKNHEFVGTNEYGFTALPGGMRLYKGDFPEFANTFAVWWSATKTMDTEAWNRGLYFNSNLVYRGHENMKSGFSVRCIKD